MNSQVLRDEDRIIAGLDYSSFELLPGTVNPRPGMRYIEDSSVSAQFFDSELTEDFRTEGVLIEDISDSVGVPFLLPSPMPYWQPFIIDHGRKKKKNKKKRNKNRQRQLPYQFQLEVQVEQETQDDVSPPTSPDISDGSTESSPTNSPMKIQPIMDLSPDKKGKKKRSKQRRRGSGRGRRLFEDADLMGVQLNGLNIGSNGIYGNPDPYSVRSPHAPNYLGLPPGGVPPYSHGPLWVPHSVIYTNVS